MDESSTCELCGGPYLSQQLVTVPTRAGSVPDRQLCLNCVRDVVDAYIVLEREARAR